MKNSFAYALAWLGIVTIAPQCNGSSFFLADLDASTDGPSDSTTGGEDSSANIDSATPDGPVQDGMHDSGRGHDSGVHEAEGGGIGRDAGDAGTSDAGPGDSGDTHDAEAGPIDGGGDVAMGEAGEAGAACTAPCAFGRLCCGTACINTYNDPFNCGGCGIRCTGKNSFCNAGSCQMPTCSASLGCNTSETCCGAVCCLPGQLCCNVEGLTTSQCVSPTPSQPTCPVGCAPACVSDRNLKRDIEPVDEQAVLAKLAEVPMSTWSHRSDDTSVRNSGPMAQDFYAALGLGGSDRAHDPIDTHGIAFAAIGALYRQMKDQNMRIEELERENANLRHRARNR